MKPEDVPDDLMSKGRGAFAEFLSKADPRRITPLSGQVNAILAAVLPAHERQVRERVAADLKRAAEGRRDYATRASEHIAAELEAEARVFDTAAHVATEPREVMWGLLPADMWTDADRPMFREGARIARVES